MKVVPKSTHPFWASLEDGARQVSSVTLREVTEADLEMLRTHRNRDDTRCWLGSAAVISEEMQRAWWTNGGANTMRIATSLGEDIGLARVDLVGEQACVGSDVFAKYRGRGLGHRVFDAACRYASDREAKMLWLQVFIENTAAVRIYLRAGFHFHPGHYVTEIPREIPGYSYRVNLHYAHMRRLLT